MAYVFDIQPDKNRPDSAMIEAGEEKGATKSKYVRNYRVIVSDDADPNYIGAELTAYELLTHPTVAAAVGTVWHTSFTNYNTTKSQPYLIAKQLTCVRDPLRASYWYITVKYDTGELASTAAKPAGDYPPSLAAIQAQVEVKYLTRERQVYTDINNAALLTPTGNRYEAPFYEQISQRLYLVTQYESGVVDDSVLQQRHHSTNSTAWNGNPARFYQILRVEGTPCTVETGAGPTTATRTKYAILTAETSQGIRDRREQTDTHFLQTPNELTSKKAFKDAELQTHVIGKIANDGTPLISNDDPPLKDWELQPAIDFNTFLPGTLPAPQP